MLFHQPCRLVFQAYAVAADQGEDFLFGQALLEIGQRRARRVAERDDHEFEVAAVDATGRVELREIGQHDRTHGLAQSSQTTRQGQLRGQSDVCCREAAVAVGLDALQIGDQGSQVVRFHAVEWHGRIQPVAGRINPPGDCGRQ